MSNQVVNVGSRGISFLQLLTVLFVGLKLGGIIQWSWWLVLLPLYGPIAVVVLVLVACVVLAALAAAVAAACGATSK